MYVFFWIFSHRECLTPNTLLENKAEVDPELLLKIVNADIVNDCSEISQSSGSEGEVSRCGAVQSSKILGINLGKLRL